MPAGLRAGDDKDIDTRLGMLDRMLLGAGQRADQRTVGPRAGEHRLRRHAQRIDDQLYRMPERSIHDLRRAGHSQIVAVVVTDPLAPQIRCIKPVLGQKIVDILPVLRRHAGFQLGDRDRRVLAVHLVRDQKVDAVRFSLHLFVDPVELDVESLGRMSRRAEHPHAAGIGDGRDDIAAMAERE